MSMMHYRFCWTHLTNDVCTNQIANIINAILQLNVINFVVFYKIFCSNHRICKTQMHMQAYTYFNK